MIEFSVSKFHIRDDSTMFNSSFNSKWYPCNGIRLTDCCYANASHFGIHRPLNQTRMYQLIIIILNNMHVWMHDYYYYLYGLCEFETSISKQEVISTIRSMRWSLRSECSFSARAEKKITSQFAMWSHAAAAAAVIAFQSNLTRMDSDWSRNFAHDHRQL